MSSPWKRRYRPTVAEQDQNELILKFVFVVVPIAILAGLAIAAIVP